MLYIALKQVRFKRNSISKILKINENIASKIYLSLTEICSLFDTYQLNLSNHLIY